MKTIDYVIIGAGPAGLQMAYFLERAGHTYLVLEAKGSVGSFFETYPRHRTLLSINKRFNLYPEPEYNQRHDWNSLLTDDYSHTFADYSDALYPSADDLCRYLRDFAERFDLSIRLHTRVIRIERSPTGEGFVISAADGYTVGARRLLMATGPCMPNRPDIEGLEHAETYDDHDLDPTAYENQRVLVVGRGNSAFEVANHIAGHAAFIHISLDNKPVKLAWQTHFVGDLRAINNNVLEMFHIKALHAALGFSVRRIEKLADGRLECHVEEHMPHWQTPGTVRETFTYDRVIICAGYRYVDERLFAPDVCPRLDEKGKYPVLDSHWQSSVPDLYFIGTSMAARDRRSASSFIHGFRYNIRTLARLLDVRYHDRPLPCRTFPLRTREDALELGRALVQHLSTTASLYQLFGLLADYLVFGEGQARLVRDVPVDVFREQPGFVGGKRCLQFTFEFGFHRYPPGSNTLDFTHYPQSADCAAHLHAVIRQIEDGDVRREWPLGESLSVRYDEHLSSSTATMYPIRLANMIIEAAGLAGALFEEPVDDYTFIPWAADDPRLKDHGVPTCQVDTVPARGDTALGS